MAEWFTERACDGFVVGLIYLPGTFEKEYAGITLRDRLGLACFEISA